MKKLNLIAAILLALPLIIFGSNYFLDFLPFPDTADGNLGFEILKLMRDGGLMVFIALTHIILGILLLIPKTRFFAALMHLPLTIGIVCFHLTLEPMGLVVGLILLLLNLLAAYDKVKLAALFSN